MSSTSGQFRCDSAGKSDLGRRRHTNEDALLLLEKHGVFCVADGVGGSERSELASEAVVHELEKAFTAKSGPCRGPGECDPVSTACAALNRASAWIHKQAGQPGTAGMASTVMVLLLRRDAPGKACALHAGDSRCYRLRDHDLQLLTRDHSGAELIGIRDEKLLPANYRNLITRAVGTHVRVNLERTDFDARPGDLFLLCSDGLNRMVPDERIAALLSDGISGDLQCLSDRLVATANDAGGADNITVILVRLRGADPGETRS